MLQRQFERARARAGLKDLVPHVLKQRRSVHEDQKIVIHRQNLEVPDGLRRSRRKADLRGKLRAHRRYCVTLSVQNGPFPDNGV